MRIITIVICCLLTGCSGNGQSDIKGDLSDGNKADLIPAEYDSLGNVITHPIPEKVPYKVSFVKEVEYGDSEEVFISDHRSAGGLTFRSSFLRFTVDEKGQVFISNGNKIEAFDADGNYLKSLGRAGRGPGEFVNHGALVPKITSNQLYAYDDGLGRINVYNTDSLSFSHSYIIDSRKIIQHFDGAIKHLAGEEYYILSDGLILMGINEFYDKSVQGGFKRYIKLNRDSEVVSDSILYYKQHPNNSTVLLELGTGKKPAYLPMGMPSESYMKISFDRDHNMYTARGDNFLIKEYDRNGNYKRAIYYPYQHSMLDEEDREAIIDIHGINDVRTERAEDYDYPDKWPAIHEFFVDDEGRIWVATITDDEENYEWWILDNDGQVIARFKRAGVRVKRNYRLQDIPQPIVRNGYFYISEEDTATGMMNVVKYRIDIEENE